MSPTDAITLALHRFLKLNILKANTKVFYGLVQLNSIKNYINTVGCFLCQSNTAIILDRNDSIVLSHKPLSFWINNI